MRIAHFSDVHALDLGGVPVWQWLSKRAAGLVNLRLNRRDKHPVALFEAVVEELNRHPPDHVIVTGDLTNLSLDPEFALARSILDRLAIGPSNVTVVPGNHDVYTWDAWWAGTFQRAFRPYVESDDSTHDGFPVVRVRGEAAIIGVSTALPSPVPLADGWVGSAQLQRLEAALRATSGKFRVLALHHPPYKNRMSFLRGLRDRARLREVLARTGCELVLHGHEHRDVRAELPGPHGPIPVIGVASATYALRHQPRRARYNVYTVAGGRLQQVEMAGTVLGN